MQFVPSFQSPANQFWKTAVFSKIALASPFWKTAGFSKIALATMSWLLFVSQCSFQVFLHAPTPMSTLYNMASFEATPSLRHDPSIHPSIHMAPKGPSKAPKGPYKVLRGPYKVFKRSYKALKGLLWYDPVPVDGHLCRLASGHLRQAAWRGMARCWRSWEWIVNSGTAVRLSFVTGLI